MFRPFFTSLLFLLLFSGCGTEESPASRVAGDVRKEIERVRQPVQDFVAQKIDFAYLLSQDWVDADIMDLQHKEQEVYATQLNELRANTPYAYLEIDSLLKEVSSKQADLADAAGGFYNHELFISTILPGGAKQPIGLIHAGMGAEFGGYRWFKRNLAEMAEEMQEPGWIFLNTDSVGMRMWLQPLPDNQNPLMEHIVSNKGVPLAALDLWPASYTGSKADYVQGFIRNINWDQVEERLQAIRSKS